MGLPFVTGPSDAVGLPWAVGLPGTMGSVESGHLVHCYSSVVLEPCADLACVLVLGQYWEIAGSRPLSYLFGFGIDPVDLVVF